MKDFLDRADESWAYRPLLIGIVLMIVALFSWAGLSSIDQHVRAVGRVIPAGKLRTIQHLEGGIVQEIRVREGQEVEEGDILFVIENRKAQSSQKELQVSIEGMQIKLFRLEAEREGREHFEVPAELRVRHPEISSAEERLFSARKSEREEKMASLSERAHQKDLILDTLKTRRDSLREEWSVASQQLKINADLFKIGAISQSRFLESQSRVKDFETRILGVEKEIPVTQAEKAEALNSLEEARQNGHARVADEMREAGIQLKQLQERQGSFSDQVARMVVKSPVKGTVNARYINTVGGVLQPGAPLVDILPADETLVVEGKITTDDRGKIYAGLPVMAKVTAYDYAVYGGIRGVLTEVSADSFSDKQGREYYRVLANLDSKSIPADMVVHAGMTVELNILSGRVTVLYAIFKPFLRLKDNAFKEL